MVADFIGKIADLNRETVEPYESVESFKFQQMKNVLKGGKT